MASNTHNPYTQCKDVQSSSALRNVDHLPNVGFLLSLPLPPDTCMKKTQFAASGHQILGMSHFKKKKKLESLQHFLLDFPTSWPPILFLLA